MKDNQQSNNINFNGPTNISGSNFSIMQDSNLATDTTSNIKYSKIKDTQTAFTPLHAKLTSALGILGSIASIYGAFYTLTNLGDINIGVSQANMFLMIISILLIMLFPVWVKLSKQGFLKPYAKLLPTLEVSDDNKIHLVKVHADCPICKGKVRLDNISGNVVGICSKNSKHRFDFDHTNYTGVRI